tara:strand:+ start:101 stop:328 length:228 start_codon:yes stop_codon:yes gene_type:complete
MERLPDEIKNKIMLYNSTPSADIIKDWFKDDVSVVSKFIHLGYCGFIPLIQFGTNGRQIQSDYEGFWEECFWARR